MNVIKGFHSLVVFCGIFASTAAFADTYTCFAAANADRGFDFDFSISVAPSAMGGRITLENNGRSTDLGVVSETGTLSGSIPYQRPVFELTLGLIGEKDISGLAEADLGRVETIEVFMAESQDGNEVLVYKLLEKGKQIGGTILISGMATACLP